MDQLKREVLLPQPAQGPRYEYTLFGSDPPALCRPTVRFRFEKNVIHSLNHRFAKACSQL